MSNRLSPSTSHLLPTPAPSGPLQAVLDAQPHLERRVRAVLLRIHADLAAPLYVNDLAAEVLVSPDYLERLFQAHLGQSITQCIQQARLARAAELLVTSFMSVSTIARQVGFRRVSYFDRVFRAQYGLSPQAYRRRAEKNDTP